MHVDRAKTNQVHLPTDPGETGDRTGEKKSKRRLTISSGLREGASLGKIRGIPLLGEATGRARIKMSALAAGRLHNGLLDDDKRRLNRRRDPPFRTSVDSERRIGL
ncbi:unnamed protein product, partial [Iphiclides podalirius]